MPIPFFIRLIFIEIQLRSRHNARFFSILDRRNLQNPLEVHIYSDKNEKQIYDNYPMGIRMYIH